ncbi:type VI secretion system-associated FHA domain protein TagH [Ideonella sp. DXS29W]|uniref:Type VI secretion system-associated FHA domain protein TagH n=1 Tax=Ideonella lacteola TaxID=2984193 RepID=A0ABU9BXY2_9BURK
MTLTLRVLSLNEQPLIQPVVAQFGPQGGTIGRADHNTLALPDPERHISRQQAQICPTEHGYCIVNVGSANPIAVGGRSVGRGESAPLRHGDRLIVGGYLLEVFDDARAAADGPTLLRRDSPPATRRQVAGLRAQPRFADALSDSTISEGHWPGHSPGHSPGLPPLMASPPLHPMGRPGWRSRDEDFVEGALATLTDVVAQVNLPSHVATRPPLLTTPVLDARAELRWVDGPPTPQAQRWPEWPERPVQSAPRSEPPRSPAEREVATVPGTLEAVLHQRADTSVPLAGPPPEPVWASPVLRPLGAAADEADRTPFQAPEGPTAFEATRPVQADPGRAELWRAFCEGAGLAPEASSSLTPAAMQRIGQLLRTSVAGCLELLALRAEAPLGPRPAQGGDTARRSNPLMYSSDAPSALKRLLEPPLRGFMDGPDAMDDAMHDLIGHAAGSVAGRGAALDGVLQRFAPAALEDALVERALQGSVSPINRQARLWELYSQHFESLRDEAHDDFQTTFGTAFACAYEQQLERWERDQSAA